MQNICQEEIKRSELLELRFESQGNIKEKRLSSNSMVGQDPQPGGSCCIQITFNRVRWKKVTETLSNSGHSRWRLTVLRPKGHTLLLSTLTNKLSLPYLMS